MIAQWVSGGLIAGLVTLVGYLLATPKLRAEARKAHAESDHLQWKTLYAEIQRLDKMTSNLRKEVDRLNNDAGASKGREDILNRENVNLRVMVRKLSKRVSDLEEVLKIGALPPDMQAALDRLDRPKS